MATASVETSRRNGIGFSASSLRSYWARASTWPLTRELSILFAFLLLTSVMTWPWIKHLRDAVADPGDPYMIAWSLWWDYHQTFHDPLNLFQANVFYPYRYTLAFSEHDYGIALLFFPLFAAGARPLTVHSVATFIGFAFCGYAAFRLVRTLTQSVAAAWIGGVVFAFIPYRFHVLSHLHYLFAGWIPLLLEALVMFARERSWKRAVWLGTTFLMNALSCVTWFVLTLPPLALTAAFLLLWYPGLASDRRFWARAGVTLCAASLALLPFMLPYYYVSEMYGLKWKDWEFAFNSPSPFSWLAAERRVKLWEGFGDRIPGGYKLFPGFLPMLLAIAAFRFSDGPTTVASNRPLKWRRNLVGTLDALGVVAGILAALAIGYGDKSFRIFGLQVIRITPETTRQALVIMVIILAVRFVLRPPKFIRLPGGKFRRHQIWLDRGGHQLAAFAIGSIWTLWGFAASLGANISLNTVIHDYIILFRSIRIPARNAMVCYVGLAVLAGLGALRLANAASRLHLGPQRSKLYRISAVAIICTALVFELRTFPLTLVKGDLLPDAVTLRLKQTSMRGGLVELPSEGGDLPRHTYMLRAADHGHPLVNATASFISPLTDQINAATGPSVIALEFMDLLEKIPASYLVIHNARIPPDRRADYEAFLGSSVATGRLRFINRFDGRDDMYAVIKTEPDVRSEAPLPFTPSIREWSVALEEDPLFVLGQHQAWSEALCRLYIASFGRLPRFNEFRNDLQKVARDVLLGIGGQDRQLQINFRRLLQDWLSRPHVLQTEDLNTDLEFLKHLLANTRVEIPDDEREALLMKAGDATERRVDILSRVVFDERFIEREHARSLVLLHFFGYLHRNPDDPPDNNMNGLLHWVIELNRGLKPEHLTFAFSTSLERQRLVR